MNRIFHYGGPAAGDLHFQQDPACLQDLNATLFVYGSGKAFTMNYFRRSAAGDLYL
jgi:hypothetical protein